MSYRILVSGASGVVGYGILKTLKNSGNFLFGTTVYDVSPADCFADKVLKPPYSVKPEYIPWLVEQIEKYKIDMIIPGIEIDMEMWNRNRDVLENTGVKLLLNNSSLINLCLDKWLFYEELVKSYREVSIRSFLDIDKIDLADGPIILKPRNGFGAKGLVKLDCKDEIVSYADRIGQELMVQEYVGDDDHEYTVSAFFDKESEVQASIAFRRKLAVGGYSEKVETVDAKAFEQIILKLASIFEPIGPTNFQFRKSNDGYKLLEINPRISSSTSIKAAFGYNEAQMSISTFLEDAKIKKNQLRSGRAIRYIEDYLFFD